MKKKRKDPADLKVRRELILEAKRDVAIVAGAGSGKTTLLAERFVEFCAPSDPKRKPVEVSRLVASTFTRKAAGELRSRIRMKLFEVIEDTSADERRRKLASEALSKLSESFIGTIHSFADRLLCRVPIEAKISPGYQIEEDSDLLVIETLELWIEASQLGRLEAEFVGHPHAPSKKNIQAAEAWIVSLLAAGVPRESWSEHQRTALKDLVERWTQRRDGVQAKPAKRIEAPDLKKLQQATLRHLSKAERVHGQHASVADSGIAVLVDYIGVLKDAQLADTIEEWAQTLARAKQLLKDLQKERNFPNAKAAWDFVVAAQKGTDPDSCAALLSDSLGPALLAPAAEALPVVLALYEVVKRRRGCIDQLDLLLQLRDLLRDNEAVRKRFQAEIDHVFLDESQDTDAIQCEIFEWLCQKPGTLTIIGDPKQSIYRFRRADISQFQRLLDLLKNRKALRGELSTNFRSVPALIEQFTAVFPTYFGTAPQGSPAGAEFEANTGWVKYSPLTAHRETDSKPVARTHILRVELTGVDKVSAEAGRAAEATLLARHLSWLLSSQNQDVLVNGKPPRGSDIVVLARVMSHVGGLCSELRRLGVPHQVSGGTKFGETPILVQFLFALSAISDSSDGPALLAWHQPPLSAVSMVDAAPRLDGSFGPEEQELRAILQDLRKNRFSRPIYQTLMELLSSSSLLRVLGLGRHAEDDLGTLIQFSGILSDRAAQEGWDFDQAAAWARTWVDHPPRISTVGRAQSDAVRIYSVHQSKGLEFPVVVLFDGFQDEIIRRIPSWLNSSDGSDYQLQLGPYRFEYPDEDAAKELVDREKHQIASELRRLYYVAATRAMEHLVIPIPTQAKGKVYHKIWGSLLQSKDPSIRTYPGSAPDVPIKPGAKGVFLAPADSVPEAKPTVVAAEKDLPPEWNPEALAKRRRPDIEVTAVTALESEAPQALWAPAVTEADAASLVEPVLLPRLRSGGVALGTAVHRALQLILSAGAPLDGAVAVASHEAERPVDPTDLKGHVERALQVLRAEYPESEWEALSEVPFHLSEAATAKSPARIIRGVIDLVLVRKNEAVIVDFKTDGTAPTGTTLADYQQQLAIYATATRTQLPHLTTVRTRLLLTASGGWL